MTEKVSAEADVFGWLDLVPDGVEIPDGYREALEAEHAAAARRAVVEAGLSTAERAMHVAVNDLAVDPGRVLPVAVDVAAWERLLGALDPVPTIPPEVHQAIAAGLARQMPDLSPGRPPQGAIDTLHHIIVHSQQRELPPDIGDRDREALQAFEAVCAAGVGVHRTAQALAQPLGTRPLEERVQAWHDFRTGPVAEHLKIIAALRVAVDTIDAERVESGRAHRCRLWSGATVDYDPIPPGIAWSVEWALQGNGRPPRAARSLAGVG